MKLGISNPLIYDVQIANPNEQVIDEKIIFKKFKFPADNVKIFPCLEEKYGKHFSKVKLTLGLKLS